LVERLVRDSQSPAEKGAVMSVAGSKKGKGNDEQRYECFTRNVLIPWLSLVCYRYDGYLQILE